MEETSTEHTFGQRVHDGHYMGRTGPASLRTRGEETLRDAVQTRPGWTGMEGVREEARAPLKLNPRGEGWSKARPRGERGGSSPALRFRVARSDGSGRQL